MPKLAVITVNYCCADAILDGIDSTVVQLREMGDAEFWIVDNASPDNSLAVLGEAIEACGFGDVVKVLPSSRNGGFGAGNNVGFQAGMDLSEPPEYFYCLNPDAAPKPGAIATLRAFMDATPDAGIAGGLLCNEDGEIETSIYRFPSFQSELVHAFRLGPVHRLLNDFVLAMETPGDVTPVDWVTGASFIARSEALKASGFFDEAFFLYWEEIELCHRLRRSGFRVYAVPEAMVLHTGGVSTGMDDPNKRIPEYWFASRDHFYRTTGLVRRRTLLDLSVVGGLVVRRMSELIRGRKMSSPHFLRDFVHYNFFKTPQNPQR